MQSIVYDDPSLVGNILTSKLKLSPIFGELGGLRAIATVFYILAPGS